MSNEGEKYINLHPTAPKQSNNKIKQLTSPPSTIKNSLQKLQLIKKSSKKSTKKSTKTTSHYAQIASHYIGFFMVK
jgi:ABC-type transporter Mla subunit MlaD